MNKDFITTAKKALEGWFDDKKKDNASELVNEVSETPNIGQIDSDPFEYYDDEGVRIQLDYKDESRKQQG